MLCVSTGSFIINEDYKMAKQEPEKKKAASKEAPQKKKSLTKMLPFIVIILLILIGGGLFAFKMINKKPEQNQSATATEKTEPTPLSTPLEDKLTYEITPAFTVNLTEFSGKKYLKISIVLEYKDPQVKTDLDKRLFQIKDSFITALATKNSKELATEEGKQHLKDELISKINVIIGKDKITNIYFGEFIIQ